MSVAKKFAGVVAFFGGGLAAFLITVVLGLLIIGLKVTVIGAVVYMFLALAGIVPPADVIPLVPLV
mgnify:CR=1 FL=1